MCFRYLQVQTVPQFRGWLWVRIQSRLEEAFQQGPLQLDENINGLFIDVQYIRHV